MQTRTVVSDDELILASDADGTGQPGDMVFKTGGVERARITAAGVGSGWPALLGGGMPVLVTDSAYGARGDGQVVLDGAMTSGSATLTSATGWFVPADVGKTICVTGAGAAGVRLCTTISAYVSATQVTLAATASSTVSSKRVVWATDDSAAINAAAVVAIAAGRPLYAPPPVTQFGTPGFYGCASGLTFSPASGTDPDTGATRTTFGIDLIFDGPGKSLRWLGADSSTFISVKGFKRHKMYLSPCGEDAASVVVLDLDTSVAYPSASGMRIAGNIDVGGGASSVGLRLGHVSGGVADISSLNFDDLFIVGNYNNGPVSGQTGILDEGSNCLCLNWFGINVYSCDVAYTNKSGAGATSPQGNDTKNFIGGNISNCNTDFQIANRGIYNFFGVRGEVGKRALDVTNATNHAAVSYYGCKWATYAPADSILFSFARPGTLRLDNPYISGTDFTATMITLAGSTGKGTVHVKGGAIRAAEPFWTLSYSGWKVYLEGVGVLNSSDRTLTYFGDTNLSYAPQIVRVASTFDTIRVVGNNGVGVLNPGANVVRAGRIIIPVTGTLKAISVFVGAASGNLMVGVYDTGDTLAGSRTSLYNSGSVAMAGTSQWQVIGDPNLAVVAGQQLDFAIMLDNGTGTVMRATNITSANALMYLPDDTYLPCAGGAKPKLAWTNSPGSFTWPSAITEANASANDSMVPLIVARIA